MFNPPKQRLKSGYVGWALSADDRDRLLAEHPFAYPIMKAHHVTLRVGVKEDTRLPTITKGIVIGIADDGRGVQALIVRVGGTHVRPDGLVYHITWSLTEDRRSFESNHVIEQFGWEPVAPIRIDLHPMFFPTDV